MSPENFVYWLNGLFELTDLKELDARQVQIIKDHLKIVLTKVTPNHLLAPFGPAPIANPGWPYPNVIPPSDFTITCSTGNNPESYCSSTNMHDPLTIF